MSGVLHNGCKKIKAQILCSVASFKKIMQFMRVRGVAEK